MSKRSIPLEVDPPSSNSGEPAYTVLHESDDKPKPSTQCPPQNTLAEKLASRAPPDRILMSRPEVALYLGISHKSLDAYSATKYHELKYSRIGIRAIYRLSDVLAYVELKQKGKMGAA